MAVVPTPHHPPRKLRHRRSRRPLGTLPTSTGSFGSVRFVHLSFEGPDPYSRAGGLAIRVTTLAEAMAATGALVDLYFVGDPALSGIEERDGVTLHRWCQVISAQAPAGVYDQEERKIEDLCIWLPSVLADVVAADRHAGRRTIVLAEDWHMAWPLIAVHDQLVRAGLRDAATLVWTANNRFGFDRIDFERLAGAAKIFTISRAMKHFDVATWREPDGGTEWCSDLHVFDRASRRSGGVEQRVFCRPGLCQSRPLGPRQTVADGARNHRGAAGPR
jgi:hypothetical protein